MSKAVTKRAIDGEVLGPKGKEVMMGIDNDRIVVRFRDSGAWLQMTRAQAIRFRDLLQEHIEAL